MHDAWEGWKGQNKTKIGNCTWCHKENECSDVALATNLHVLSPYLSDRGVKAVRLCDDKDDAHGGCCKLPWYANGYR
jgi:hypothetical protein